MENMSTHSASWGRSSTFWAVRNALCPLMQFEDLNFGIVHPVKICSHWWHSESTKTQWNSQKLLWGWINDSTFILRWIIPLRMALQNFVHLEELVCVNMVYLCLQKMWTPTLIHHSSVSVVIFNKVQVSVWQQRDLYIGISWQNLICCHLMWNITSVTLNMDHCVYLFSFIVRRKMLI